MRAHGPVLHRWVTCAALPKCRKPPADLPPEAFFARSGKTKTPRYNVPWRFWCGRWDLNPHVYGWTQAPQACLSTDSSTPAYAYALVKCMSYYNRYARNVNHKFSTQVDFFVFLSAGAVWRVSVTRTTVRTASAAMSASAPSAIGSR